MQKQKQRGKRHTDTDRIQTGNRLRREVNGDKIQILGSERRNILHVIAPYPDHPLLPKPIA